MTRAKLPRPHEVQAAARDPRLLRARCANPDDPAWRSQGRCRTVDASVFFPLPTEPADLALAICRGCDVRPQCLAAALNAGDCEGIFAATTPRERRAMLVAWRNCGGTIKPAAMPPATARRPVPAGAPPVLCVNRHEQSPEIRATGADGRPYCRACQSAAGSKGNAVRYGQVAS